MEVFGYICNDVAVGSGMFDCMKLCHLFSGWISPLCLPD